MATIEQIDNCVTEDFISNNISKRMPNGMNFSCGMKKIFEKYRPSWNSLNKKKKEANDKLNEYEIVKEKLFHSLQKEIQGKDLKIIETEVEIEKAKLEVTTKENALIDAKKQLQISLSFENKGVSNTPAIATKRVSFKNANTLAFILLVDFAVLLSSWTILRQTLSADQVIHRSIIVIVISIISFVLDKNYHQYERKIHLILSVVTTLMVISSVFTGIILDIFLVSTESFVTDNFSLTDIEDVKQTSNSLLNNYTSHPGTVELLIAFFCFLIGKFFLKQEKNSVEIFNQTEQEEFMDKDSVNTWQARVKECEEELVKQKKMVEIAEKNIEIAEKSKNNFLSDFYIEINKSEDKIKDISFQINEYDNAMKELFYKLKHDIFKYENILRKRMSIKLSVTEESIQFETITDDDILMYFNLKF